MAVLSLGDVLSNYTPSSGNALPGTAAAASPFSTVALYSRSVSSGKAVTPALYALAPAPAASQGTATTRINKEGTPLDNGGCGPEPPRKAANASGSAQFVDGHVGNAWLACLDRVAAEKAARAAAASAAAPAPAQTPAPSPAPPTPDFSARAPAPSPTSSPSSAASSAPQASAPLPDGSAAQAAAPVQSAASSGAVELPASSSGGVYVAVAAGAAGLALGLYFLLR